MTVLLTRELLAAASCCAEGYRFALDHNLIGLPYEDVISFCDAYPEPIFADWLRQQKTEPAYKFFSGGLQVSTRYKLFNPITGLHETYDTTQQLNEGRRRLAEELLARYSPVPVIEKINENGDSLWEPFKPEDVAPLTVSVS